MNKPTSGDLRLVLYWVEKGSVDNIPESVLVEFPELRKAINDVVIAEKILTAVAKSVEDESENYDDD